MTVGHGTKGVSGVNDYVGTPHGYCLLVLSCLFCFLLASSQDLFALTVDEIIQLKKAGVSDETIQSLIKSESEERQRQERYDPSRTVGSKEIVLPDGRRQIIYYSITDPAEDERKRREEQERLDKSWDVLKNVIIDQRKAN